METRSLTLGEILDGDRMAVSLYDVKFKGEFPVECRSVGKASTDAFQYGIKHNLPAFSFKWHSSSPTKRNVWNGSALDQSVSTNWFAGS